MARSADRYLLKLNRRNAEHSTLRQIILILSLAVTLYVFWQLKLTGITMAGEAFCGKAEHVHDESCTVGELICTLPEEEAHVHSESCLVHQLVCQLEESEAHTHGADCVDRTLICGMEEAEGHAHAEACYQQELICGLPEEEAHVHEESCYTRSYGCGLEESEEHTHDETCITEALSCELPETGGHAHGPECYEQKLICQLEEVSGHSHEDACYTLTGEGYICGLEETQGHTHSDECWYHGAGFGCGLTEEEGHVHTAECLTEQTELGCGLEETQGHTHTAECYETVEQCPIEEHIHIESCYSNLDADLETADDWEMTLAGLQRSPITAENVVAVARSQLGYQESTLNFQVDAAGVRRGITRYGQWYGNPYGDWSAMFASFCLYYAGVEDVPANGGPEAMRLQWEEAGLYKAAAEWMPKTGDLIFLHIGQEEGTVMTGEAGQEPAENTEPTESQIPRELLEKRLANAVAIITAVDGDTVTVIRGDLNGAVAEETLYADDPAVLGYGLVPSESELVILVEAPEEAAFLARTTDYNQSMFTGSNCFVLYTEQNGNYYAFDGSGNAVRVYLDESGNILSDVDDPGMLLWTFSGSYGSYTIRNLSTGRYMHTYSNNGAGVTTTGAYASALVSSGSGVKIRSNSDYARLDEAAGLFVPTQDFNQAAVYRFGINTSCTVWLDGTGGGQSGQQGGTENRSYTVALGSTFQLPTTWQSPGKYSQTLRGWYDVTNQKYYAPGDKVVATGNMVFYADWAAATYDIGQYNAQVADTVSTSSFITTRVYDYNYLFNVQSANASVTADANSHQETWSMVDNGTVAYNNAQSLEFVFVDYDGAGKITEMNNRNDANTYLGEGIVTSGVYTPELERILYGTGNEMDPETGEGIIGKTYLGTGDHLFQFMSDPNDPHYGYYYYDSQRNAASYNQSEGRFYVYEYLEATSDSLGTDMKSDFLPFNSPYANTNGNIVRTYTYGGENGEYNGTTHYRYDAKYSDDNNSASYVGTNYAFGMKMDVRFYLPVAPGQTDENGQTGNKDVYGNDMHFQFYGDDDVWVLVDGKLVLDIGGIHGVEGGDINFSTGIVTVNGTVDQDLTAALRSVGAGEHTLTVMYLERGSSQSNAAFYFNLAPRFSLSIQKEDVLTQDVLNGAQFSVYTDEACTVPAKLYTSEASYRSGQSPINTFTVENGVANMWGFASGNTYYIRETKPPDAAGYDYASGIIRLTIDKDGYATYHVAVLEDTDGTDPSIGFTVHGFRIDEETQKAYIVATNAKETITEATSVQVSKKWADNQSHNSDYITAYLTVTDPDGTVRRIREVILSKENNWVYTWTNLPKTDPEGNPVVYGVQEANISGYVSRVEVLDGPVSGGSGNSGSTGGSGGTATVSSFENGETYLLSTPYGYLGAANEKLLLEGSQESAQSSNTTQWVATVNSDGTVTLVNKAGQTFYYDNYTFKASANPGTYRNLRFSDNILCCYIDHGGWSETLYPVRGDSVANNVIYNGVFYTTNDVNQAMPITAWKLGGSDPEPDPVEPSGDGSFFQITNTPLDTANETSVAVQKQWNTDGTNVEYEQFQVTVRLLANGKDTGRTVTLNLKNNWKDTFHGLTYRDENGNVISYTVEEIWHREDWTTYYSDVIASGGDPKTYSVAITNIYQPSGPQLPSTGSPARLLYMLCGAGMMLASLVYGIGSRRKRERRMK